MKDNEIKTNKKDKTKGRKIKSSFLFEKNSNTRWQHSYIKKIKKIYVRSCIYMHIGIYHMCIYVCGELQAERGQEAMVMAINWDSVFRGTRFFSQLLTF